MSKAKVLLKNTVIVSIGKIATQFITFLLLPIYTAVLTNEEYGVVDLLNTLTSLLLPIATFQIEQGIFRYLVDCREDKEKQSQIITTVFKFMIIQAIIYIIIFLGISKFINNNYKYFLVGNLLACMFSTILLQICRGMGDNKKYAFGSFISGVTTVVLNIIFIVVFKLGAYGMLTATFIANILCGIYVLLGEKIYKYIKIGKYDKQILKEMIKYSVPLVPNMISWWIVDASDRTIISTILGIGKNGIYSAANKFSNVFASLYSVFNLTWTESASININSPDKDEFFSKILDVTLRFFGSLAIGIIAFLPFVFPILINEKFSEAYYQVPILMVGSMFNVLVSFIGSIYVAKKITKEIAKTSIFAAIINITINLICIRWIGLYAASISTLIAYFSMFIYRYIDSKKYVKLKVNKKIVISMLGILIISIAFYYMENPILQILNVLLVAVYTVSINKTSVKFIWDNMRKKLTNKSKVI